jgi:hypothetical protein
MSSRDRRRIATLIRRRVKNLEVWDRRHTTGSMHLHLQNIHDLYVLIGDVGPLWLRVLLALHDGADPHTRHFREGTTL